MAAAADWSSLPIDLVRLITNELPGIEDFAALKLVCRSYSSAVDLKQWREDASSRPPWLLLSGHGGDHEDDNPPESHRSFLLVGKQRKIVINLPEIRGRRCWGSSYGWIVTLGLDRQLHLFNPLTHRRILLPQSDYVEAAVNISAGITLGSELKSRWMRKYHIKKAILIKRPPSLYSSCGFNNFIIVIMSRRFFNVIRPQSWAPVKFYSPGNIKGCSQGGNYSIAHVHDLAIHNDNIYIIGDDGQLFICSNFDGSDQPIADECAAAFFKGMNEDDQKLYLVESLGELVMLVRIYDYQEDTGYRTARFDAYKFNHETKDWIKLENIGDCAIFVGDCPSMALTNPEKFGFRRNSVYFTDDNYELFGVEGHGNEDPNELFGDFCNIGGRDMGVYNFEQMNVEPFYDGAESLSTYSTPTWLFPRLT